MAERAALVIHTEVTSVRTGIWCDTCLTSARIEADLLSLTEHGVSVLGTIQKCMRCDPA